MASKGGKGGGQAQSVFGPRGGGMSGGGIFDMLRQQFPQMMPQQQQPQFAPVPPPMQTPGQQFSPFNGEPMTRTADQNPQLPGQPQGAVPAGPDTLMFNPGRISPMGFLPDGTIGHLPPTQNQPGGPTGGLTPGGQQFAPQGTPFHGTPNPGFAPFNPSPIGVGQGQPGQFGGGGQQPLAPASPLGPLVNPRGGRRGLL